MRKAWRKIKAWFVAVLVTLGLLSAPILHADDIGLSWTNATEWDDNTPLQDGDLLETVIMMVPFPLGTDLATAPRNYSELARVPWPQQTFTHADQPNGIYCYVAYHVATNGVTSVNSNETCKTIDVRVPGAPSNLQSN